MKYSPLKLKLDFKSSVGAKSDEAKIIASRLSTIKTDSVTSRLKLTGSYPSFDFVANVVPMVLNTFRAFDMDFTEDLDAVVKSNTSTVLVFNLLDEMRVQLNLIDSKMFSCVDLSADSLKSMLEFFKFGKFDIEKYSRKEVRGDCQVEYNYGNLIAGSTPFSAENADPTLKYWQNGNPDFLFSSFFDINVKGNVGEEVNPYSSIIFTFIKSIVSSVNDSTYSEGEIKLFLENNIPVILKNLVTAYKDVQSILICVDEYLKLIEKTSGPAARADFFSTNSVASVGISMVNGFRGFNKGETANYKKGDFGVIFHLLDFFGPEHTRILSTYDPADFMACMADYDGVWLNNITKEDMVAGSLVDFLKYKDEDLSVLGNNLLEDRDMVAKNINVLCSSKFRDYAKGIGSEILSMITQDKSDDSKTVLDVYNRKVDVPASVSSYLSITLAAPLAYKVTRKILDSFR